MVLGGAITPNLSAPGVRKTRENFLNAPGVHKTRENFLSAPGDRKTRENFLSAPGKFLGAPGKMKIFER